MEKKTMRPNQISKNGVRWGGGESLLALVVASAMLSAHAGMQCLDSAEFSHKYEMEQSITAEDIDADGYADFTAKNSPTVSVSSGALVCGFNSSGAWLESMSDSGDGCAWRKLSPAQDGYTIELRMRVSWQDSTKTHAVALAVSDGSGCDVCLNFRTNNLAWGNNVITNMVTTDTFHTYRIAKRANADQFTLWCDGVLVTQTLGDALPSEHNNNRFLIGAIGAAWKGGVQVSYLRFTKGAYVPPRRPAMMDSAQFAHKYEMDVADSRFSPTATTSDWTPHMSVGVTPTLRDGALAIEPSSGKVCYYQTTGAMDSAVEPSSPFTFEIKTRAFAMWKTDANRGALHVYCGTSRAMAGFYVGTNSVRWDVDGVVFATGDNALESHVFRVAYEGDGLYGFSLWRDGEKLAGNLKGSSAQDNCVRFGVASTTHGGSSEVDYIRWTIDAAYAPYVPPPGMILIVE